MSRRAASGLDRRIENELVPFCQKYGLAILPWSPLAGGILALTSGLYAIAVFAALVLAAEPGDYSVQYRISDVYGATALGVLTAATLGSRIPANKYAASNLAAGMAWGAWNGYLLGRLDLDAPGGAHAVLLGHLRVGINGIALRFDCPQFLVPHDHGVKHAAFFVCKLILFQFADTFVRVL